MEHHESVGRFISYIYRGGQTFIGKELEEYGIGSGQYVYLLALYKKDGIIQDTLADLLKTDKATVARSLKKLEEEGYITRCRSVSDRRAFEIYLTDKGRQLRPVLIDILNQWMEVLLKDFTAEEKDHLLILLKKMFSNICLEHEMTTEGRRENESK